MYFQNLDGSTFASAGALSYPPKLGQPKPLFAPRSWQKRWKESRFGCPACLCRAPLNTPKMGKLALFPGPKKHDLAIALRTDIKTNNQYICITDHPLTQL